MQQFRAMAENGVRKPKPRTQFFTDLDQTLAQHVKAKDKLILSMDANEPDHPGSALAQWKERNGLTNIMHHLHGEASTRTYQGGRLSIDHTYINDNTLPALQKGGHIPFNRFHISGHCGQFADFHKPTLFGKNAPDPTDGTTKYPRPYHPTERDKYHKILSAYFKQHKIKDQLQNMIPILEKYEPGKAPMEVIKKVNAIERKQTVLMKSAARQCHNVKIGGKYPYSPKLVTAAQLVLYWKDRLSCHRNEVPMPADKDIFRIMYEITDTAGDHRLLIEQQLIRAFTSATLAWTTITDEDEMYGVLLQHNMRKLLASANNPFATGPLNELLGHMGEKPAANALLDGTPSLISTVTSLEIY